MDSGPCITQASSLAECRAATYLGGACTRVAAHPNIVIGERVGCVPCGCDSVGAWCAGLVGVECEGAVLWGGCMGECVVPGLDVPRERCKAFFKSVRIPLAAVSRCHLDMVEVCICW